MRHITILDTTLRDGDQAAGFAFSPNEKPSLAVLLAEAGVDIVEAGFPLSSHADFVACQAVVSALKGGTTKVAMMCRADIDEIRTTSKLLGNDGIIHITLPVSDSHRIGLLNISRTKLLKKAVETVSFASGLISTVEIGAEDATRTNVDFLCDYCNTVIEAGAIIVNIADTLGVFSPPQITTLIETLRERVPEFTSGKSVLSVHCHNDYGLAVANTLAAIKSGCQQIEAAMCGFGERAGNAALEEIAINLDAHSEIYEVTTGLRLDRLNTLATAFCRSAGISLGPLKPLLGWNVHAHASGIHQKGLTISTENYLPDKIQNYTTIPKRIVLSRHSGKSGVRMAAANFGIKEIDDITVNQLLEQIKNSEEQTFGVTEFINAIFKLGLLPKDSPPPIFCSSFSSEYQSEKICRIRTTLSDGRTVNGEGANIELAILDSVQELSAVKFEIVKTEWNGIDGKCRLYTEIFVDGEIIPLERIGIQPSRLLLECCLDVINQLNLKLALSCSTGK